MQSERPYFMKNREWYSVPQDEGIDDILFEDGRGYHIKESAPKEVVESYNHFYGMLEGGLEKVLSQLVLPTRAHQEPIQ